MQKKLFDETQKKINVRLRAKFSIEDLYREYPSAKVLQKPAQQVQQQPIAK